MEMGTHTSYFLPDHLPVLRVMDAYSQHAGVRDEYCHLFSNWQLHRIDATFHEQGLR